MVLLALCLYVAGLSAAFGIRTWLHARRTGSSGFHGVSGSPGSLRWWTGVSFVVALVLGGTALLPAAIGAVAAPSGRLAEVVAVAGVGVALCGFAVVLAAQTDMGASWRIGVEESERTELVSGGLFRAVRNPIFSGMVAAQVGIVAMVPTWLSLAALVWLILAVELQVRLIEEPYLLAVHGAAYRRYAEATGRFLPLIGRWRTAGKESALTNRGQDGRGAGSPRRPSRSARCLRQP